MKNVESMGKRIAECRKNCGMTQEEMAARIGITPQALSKWERNISFPDVPLLADVCTVLGVSADYLLGVERQKVVEDGNEKEGQEVWKNLENSLKPLELVFGMNLVKYFGENSFVSRIQDLRKSLAKEGILLPIVNVRDEPSLEGCVFRVMSYRKMLYTEQIYDVDIDVIGYIVAKLGEVVSDKYDFVLNVDLVKSIVDNLRKKRPALVEGIVPEKISYGMLTDVYREFIKRGNSAVFFELLIESIDRELRKNPEIDMNTLMSNVIEQLEKMIKDE